MKKTKLYYLILVLSIIWILGFSFPFFIKFSDSLNVYLPILKLIYSPVCHQLIERSFLIDNAYFFVCSRCTGIYVGVFFSLLFLMIYEKEIKIISKIFLFSLSILITDIIFYNIGFYNYNKIVAFSTGFFAGFTILLYIFPSVKNLIIIKKTLYDE